MNWKGKNNAVSLIFILAIWFKEVIHVALEEVSDQPKHANCQEVAEKSIASGAIGGFVPKCLDNGLYSPLQCHGSTGVCWCVDKFGDLVPEAVIKKTPCNNPCFKKVLKNPTPAILIQGSLQPVHFDTPTPNCDAEGFYEPKQCSGQFCWCVDRYGSELPNTRDSQNNIHC